MDKKNFIVSTPGKVILHGEHAVVYKRPAVAAAIGIGTTLRFVYSEEKEASEVKSNLAEVELESLQSNFTLPLDAFNEFLQKYRQKYDGISQGAGNNSVNNGRLLEAVREEFSQADEMIKECGYMVSKCPTMQTQIQNAYIAIYYVLAGAILSSPKKRLIDNESGQTTSEAEVSKGFKVYISTELNIGAGLGSSASFGVALAAAFLIYAEHFDLETYQEEKNFALISQWAYESERIMHGIPSGVDNTVCTYGGLLRFVKGQEFQRLHLKQPLDILLVDSKVNRSSADIVAKVRHLKETFPHVIDSIWNTCEAIVDEAIPLYESYGTGVDDSQKFEKLERLFQINNDLLKAIGVSHPKLEQIFSIAFKRGFFSKLTGAGAGGYVIVLLPENYEKNEVYGKLCKELESAGYGVCVTTAGGNGLRVSPLTKELETK